MKIQQQIVLVVPPGQAGGTTSSHAFTWTILQLIWIVFSHHTQINAVHHDVLAIIT